MKRFKVHTWYGDYYIRNKFKANNKTVYDVKDKFGEKILVSNAELTDIIYSKSLEELAKPLIDWLYENGTPHSIITIQLDNVTLYHGQKSIPFKVRD